MSRLNTLFSDYRSQGRKALVAYVVAGDPDLELTVPLMHALVEAGVDVIEVGVPFSDPMSEGPVIQLGHERALEHNTSLRDVFKLVEAFRADNSTTPLVLMGYANPVERMGYAAFAEHCAKAQVDGLITVDLPPEEVGGLNVELKKVGIDNIFLMSPTTPEARMDSISEQASGFIYYVAVKGVTGAGHLDTADVAQVMGRIRQHTDLPVAVGFGIKDRTSAEAVGRTADGVVVGSALVDCVAKAYAAGGDQAAAIQAAKTLIGDIRTGVDAASS